MSKLDTVRDKYYKPSELTERVGGWLFWIVSILSIATLFVDKVAHPVVAGALPIAFIVCVLLFFIQGQAQKLYLIPRAEDKRRQELLSNSFGVTLTHEETDGYYNNDQTMPLKRLAASVMESSFFTQNIVRKMLVGMRAKTLGYFSIYLIAALNRSTDLELLAIAAQVIFSEDIISRWLRMEWLRMRSEQIFENLNRLFTGKNPFSKPVAQAQAVDFFSFYETTKSTASILLSPRLFSKNNRRLTTEWDQIRSRLEI